MVTTRQALTPDGMPGDLDYLDDYQDFVYKPKWNDTECTDGFWTPATRGGGAGWDASEGWPGTWGLLSANWGGHWKEAMLQRHMHIDLRTHNCQVICLQEADESLYQYLRTDSDADAQRADGMAGGSGAPQGGWDGRIGVRGGTERKSGLMICARMSLALGIRLLVLHRILDGEYKCKGGPGAR